MLAQFQHDVASEFRVIEVTRALISSAVLIAQSHALRGYDALVLAAAIDLNSQRLALGLAPLTLVSADRELNAVALALGLQIEDPNTH